MSASELRELSSEELAAKARELRVEIFNLKVKHSTGQLEDTARLRGLRRDVARVETVMRERREATTG
jgi:large subunit ribosomal protein L29